MESDYDSDTTCSSDGCSTDGGSFVELSTTVGQLEPLPFARLNNQVHVVFIQAPDRDSHQSDISRLADEGFMVVVLGDDQEVVTPWLPPSFICYGSNVSSSVGRMRMRIQAT